MSIEPTVALQQGRTTGWTPAADRQSEFDAFLSGFERAAEALGVRDHCFKLGGYSVRVRFAGPVLEGRMAPALLHTAIPPCDPDFTICAWDTESSGVCLPAGIGPLEAHLDRAMPGVGAEGGVRSGYRRPDSGLSMLHESRDLGVYWVRDGARIAGWDCGTPFRSILSWWMGAHGQQFLHAAVVGTESGAVAIAGRSGAGKSTTAVACLQAGLAYVGDDYCLLQTEPDLRAYTLYCSAKLTSQSNALLPESLPPDAQVQDVVHEKDIFVLGETYGARIVEQLPLRAILLPQIVDRVEPGLRPAPRSLALATMAPSTLLQLTGERGPALEAMGALVERCPAYVVELGRDTTLLGPLIRDLLASLAPAEREAAAAG